MYNVNIQLWITFISQSYDNIWYTHLNDYIEFILFLTATEDDSCNDCGPLEYFNCADITVLPNGKISRFNRFEVEIVFSDDLIYIFLM